MKKLLIFLGIMLLAAGSYAGIIYDNTTDDISSSSGTMTIDGSPVGGGTHPVNLASDVTGELPHASTSDDAAQVHGLGASVNVLGNRNASGEFVQRGTINPGTGGSSAISFFSPSIVTVTFTSAFNAAPIVLGGGMTDDNASFSGSLAHKITTTTFDFMIYGRAANFNPANAGWVALGN